MIVHLNVLQLKWFHTPSFTYLWHTIKTIHHYLDNLSPVAGRLSHISPMLLAMFLRVTHLLLTQSLGISRDPCWVHWRKMKWINHKSIPLNAFKVNNAAISSLIVSPLSGTLKAACTMRAEPRDDHHCAKKSLRGYRGTVKLKCQEFHLKQSTQRAVGR